MYQNRDILWKGLLELVFDDFLRFFYPKAEEIFDLEKGFVFLDKELAELYPKSEEGVDVRLVDKLVKLHLKDGREECILIHVEVQAETKAQNRPVFPERMFRYFYRVLDRYKMPVETIAVFTGRDGRLLTDIFSYSCIESWLLFRYKAICVLDYSNDELLKSDNPFALVMMIAKQALLKGKNFDETLLAGKLFVFRKLYEQGGLNRAKMEAILSFLHNYVLFEQSETNLVFKNEIDKITNKKNTMNIFEQVAEIRAQEGLEQGLEQGRKEGAQIATRKFVKNLLENYEIDEKEVASLAGVTVTFVKKVKAEMEE